MFNVKVISLLFISIVFLSSCSTTSPFCEIPKALSEDQSAEIVIYRPDAFYGILYSTPFSIDGCRVNDLSNNSYMSYRIPAGEHIISAEVKALSYGGDGVVKGNFEAGKTYYLHYSISAGESYYITNSVVGFTTSTQFFMVDKLTAFKLMPKLIHSH